MIQLIKPILGKNEVKIVTEIINSKMIASGKYVEQFEKETALFNGTKYAIASSNGTTALHTALIACGIKQGDKVLTTPFSFIATANSILYCGAKPVFADIDPATYNLSPEAAEAKLKEDKDIKAIIIVHLYGLPADMPAFLKLKKKYKIVLIEDCAQAHGAKINGKIVGSIGDASAFSYYASKNMTTGEGGMILTNNSKIDKLSRQIINHGRSSHSTHTVLGYNYRMTNIAAGIGLCQLKSISDWNKKRRKNAEFLNSRLSKLNFLNTPVIPENSEPVFHQYTVRVKNGLRNKFMEYLLKNEIGCGIYYSAAIYRQPIYQNIGYKAGLCIEAERAAKEVLSLPVHPSLTSDELKKIVEVIENFKK